MYRLRHEEVKLTHTHPDYESTNSPQRFLLYVRLMEPPLNKTTNFDNLTTDK